MTVKSDGRPSEVTLWGRLGPIDAGPRPICEREGGMEIFHRGCSVFEVLSGSTGG